MSSLSDGLVPPFSPTTMDDSEKTCRVCRSGEEPGNPLYKPCKCSGSISWIHQDCLESWLSVSRAQRCELCKHPFKWEKVYASQAPAKLPPTLIARHLIQTIITGISYFIRFLFVAFMWLAFLPYSILWVWRGLFHLAKGWGTSWTAAIQEVEWSTVALSSIFTPSEQQPFRTNVTAAALAAQAAASVTPAATASQTALSHTIQDEDGAIKTLSRMINGTIVSTSVKPKVEALEDAISELFKAWFKPEDKSSNLQQAVLDATQTVTISNANVTSSWLPRSAFVDRALFASTEALSSKWKAHKGLLYSVGEDIFSGQVIVACVVVAFIAAFLLREWVMANQPHAHAAEDHEPVPNVLGNVNQAQVRAVEEVMARFEEINARRDREGGQDDARFPFGVEAHRELGLPPLEPIVARNLDARRNDAESVRIREEDWALYNEGRNTPQSERDTSASLPFDYGGNRRNTSSRPTSPTPSDEETSAGLIRRRAWGSERDLGMNGQIPSSATGSNFPHRSNDMPASPYAQASGASTSGNTSPLSPVARPRTYSNDFGIESASDGESDHEPLAAPVPGPAPNPARRPRVHDFDNDSDSEDGDEDDDMFGGVGAADPNAPIAENDPAAFDGDDNPDDLFFEADLQGILEAVGIHGPILALLQNVALVTLLIACLLVVSVWLPLMFGKTIAATNAQKIFLLPINFVRLFTDPLADRLVGLLGKRQDTVPISTVKRRLLSALGMFSASSSTHSKPLSSQFQFYIEAYLADIRTAITAIFVSGFRGMKNQWYAMAIGDSNIDRTLCIVLGYLVIGAAAGAYLHHTQNIQAREAGAAVRDIVKQHFLLVKAAMFFFVEIVIFPTICGLLINLSTVPLIPESTISTRLAYYYMKPISSIFCTWLAGTNFMFSFAQTISIVRKCIRKGVLYFIRDPSDPEANPLREILETPAINQAKKISRSLLVYGGIIITCFGFFPWMSRLVPMGLFPLRWNMTRPLAIIPFDYIYLLTIVPITLGRAKPKRAIRGLFKQWCEITCHQLRLSSFMLGKRIDDEEGTHVRRTWKAWLLLKKAPVPSSKSSDKQPNSIDGFKQDEDDDEKKDYTSNSDVIFRKDGGFARTVASDHIKIVTQKMFVRTNINGEPITEEGKEAIKLQLKEIGNDESKFTIVYVPPNFKFRILFFIYLLWLSCAIGIFIAFVTPLIVGRIVLDLITPEPLHDTYSIIAGIHVLTFLNTVFSFAKRRIQVYTRYQQDLSEYALGAHPAREVFGVLSVQTIQLIILGINGGILMPLFVGIATHLYLIIPFEIIFGSVGSDGLSHVSFIMDWCYGVVTVQLACRIACTMKENWLSRLLREVKNHGITRNASLLNRYMFRINRNLLLSICMPLLVAHSHRLMTGLIWRYLIRATAPPPPSAYNQAYVFKIALLSVSGTGLAILLSGPVKRLSKKWSAAVWEKEFVVKRKLRNMDEGGLDMGGTDGEGDGNQDEAGDGGDVMLL